ncbi:MAG: putative metal-binding motif-containing protein [Gammaproteobacteria bacterium]|nr:putative metal-binding motif-containing protein [Gammaproteobacteria bacterium]
MNGLRITLGMLLAATGFAAACSTSSDDESKSKSKTCTLAADCAAAPATSPPGCAEAACESGVCAFKAKDADGDGHSSSQCSAVGSVDISVGDDCDDADPAIHPGAGDGPANAATGEPDQCDLKDQDCDGTSDDEAVDGKSCSCDTGASQLCATDELGQPIPGLDGTKHEIGICKLGTKQCAPGKPVKCVGAVGPSAKDCTSPLDNDCNEKPDNTELTFCACNLGETKSCQTGNIGECATGTKTCQSSGASAVWGPCVSPSTGAPDCSQSLDKDCDGVPDNLQESCKCDQGGTKFAIGVTAPCQTHPGFDGTGACKAGQQTCVLNGTSAEWTACGGSVGPLAQDTCDPTKDLNCDGKSGNGVGCTVAVYTLIPASQQFDLCDFDHTSDVKWSFSIEAGWQHVAQFQVYKTQQPGTIAAVKCINGKHGSFFGSCPAGWTLEQTMGWVKTTPGLGFTPLQSFPLPGSPSTLIVLEVGGGVTSSILCSPSSCKKSCSLLGYHAPLF